MSEHFFDEEPTYKLEISDLNFSTREEDIFSKSITSQIKLGKELFAIQIPSNKWRVIQINNRKGVHNAQWVKEEKEGKEWVYTYHGMRRPAYVIPKILNEGLRAGTH